jgi:membrane protease YdiL (CAAX protease family)
MLLALHPEKSPAKQLDFMGFRSFSVKYVFFIVFSALFMMSASIVISMLFGGAESSAQGLTLLGTFTAGKNDHMASIPYLVLVYVLVPAFAEELLLRGMVFSNLRGLGFASAAVISACLSGLMSFSLGGFIPAAFAGLVSCFVLYTTGSLWACVIVRIAFNLYRLLLEVNICAYYVSAQSRELIVAVMLLAFLLFGALFFGECSKIFRERSEREASRESLSCGSFVSDIKRVAAYRPTVIMAISCAVIFAAVVLINYLT